MLVGLDGDDTLWHNETFFMDVHQRFVDLLGGDASIERRLSDTQIRNLELYGYGAKAFTLSMIETALELTGGDLAASSVQAILDLGKTLLRHPVQLLDGVQEAIDALAAEHRLVLITKGDLLHQEAKVAGSGLGQLFERVEIVSEKDEAAYRRVLRTIGGPVDDFVMVGNSLRSDVLPPVAIGARAVHVPYEIEWAHETVPDAALPKERWWRLDSISELPELIGKLGA